MVPITNDDDKEVIRRRTSQRDLVLEAVCTGNHLSAREIFELVSGGEPRLSASTDGSAKNRMSFGTVYRNLQILEEEGKIVAIKADPELWRYDRNRERHHHLHCTQCGKVFDISVPYRPEFYTEAAQKSGFTIDSHTITFEGVCRLCKDIR
ncbi:transcriptional repressor [Spirochaetia bacterium]|nr:transcriptional repressor [Spirochaetia bacterium]